jgi:hypothetical protein
MPITRVQQGAIGQFLAAILMMMGSGGKLEVAVPMSDDERRDQEVHARGMFGVSLALQIKTSMQLHLRNRLVAPLLVVHFKVPAERLISHPLFWYLFAYLDEKTMAFADPIFLVDSATVHAHAVPKLQGGVWQFEVQASMGPKAHDLWAPFRVHPADLGDRVLQILHSQALSATLDLASIRSMTDPDLLWVGRRAAQAS